MPKLGEKMPLEWRQKISAAHLGKKKSDAARAAMSAAKKGKPGRKLSGAEKENLRRANLGRKLTPEHREKLRQAKLKNPTNYWLGKKRGPCSPEWRAAISAGNAGKIQPPDAVARTAAKNRGQKRTSEQIERFRAAVTPEMREKLRQAHYGKSPSHKKRVPYLGINFRSTYEVRVVKALDALGIKWEYEKKRFDLGDRTYLPDFYLPTEKIYWEVKGWYKEDDKEKTRLFREKYPEEILRIVMKPDIEQLERKVLEAQ